MAFRALTQVLRGNAPPVEPGELIPDTFVASDGSEHPVDFERLVELGAAEKDTPAKAKSAKAKASEPPAEEPPAEEPAEPDPAAAPAE